MGRDRLIHDWCKHGHDHVGCNAELVLVGEAGGANESERQEPFVGSSGYALETWWREVGLYRAQFFLTNVVPYQPLGNKIFLVPKDELAHYAAVLRQKLSALPNPVVIVPTGNTAMRALFSDPKMNITDYRGSILGWRDLNGRTIKVIPTIHPAATMRQKILTKLCLADWKRIAAESRDPRILLPKRHHIVDPSKEELYDYAGRAQSYFFGSGDVTELPPRVITVDVENDIKTKKLLCVGFSFDFRESITISTLEKDFDDVNHFRIAQETIQFLLKQAWPTVYQNGMTDVWKLARHWPDLKQQIIDGYVWDLIEMDHCLDPNDGGDTSSGSEIETDEGLKVGMRDLGTLASLYTKEPYYKHEGGSFSQEKRWIYNGKDACVQREIFDVLWWRLYERGLV